MPLRKVHKQLIRGGSSSSTTSSASAAFGQQSSSTAGASASLSSSFLSSQPARPAAASALVSEEDAAAAARAQQLLARSIVGKHPEALYTQFSSGGVKSHEQKVADRREHTQTKNDTLSQWYGMKRFSKNMTREMRQDLELLRYRNFLDKDSNHLGGARGTSKKNSPYFELGYFTDVPKKKRKKRFADEMLNEDPALKERVEAFAKREGRRRKKVQERTARKRNNMRDKAREEALGGRKHGGGKKRGK